MVTNEKSYSPGSCSSVTICQMRFIKSAIWSLNISKRLHDTITRPKTRGNPDFSGSVWHMYLQDRIMSYRSTWIYSERESNHCFLPVPNELIHISHMGGRKLGFFHLIQVSANNDHRSIGSPGLDIDQPLKNTLNALFTLCDLPADQVQWPLRQKILMGGIVFTLERKK